MGNSPVLRFLRRFSLERLGWSKLLLWHLPAATIFSLLQLGLYVVISSTLFGNAGHGVWDAYKYLLANEFQSSFLVYFAIIFAAIAYARLFGGADNPVLNVSSKPARPTSGANDRLQRNSDPPTFLRRMSIKENGRISLIDIDSIDWIESYGNYVLIYTPGRRHIYRETMAAMEKRLDPGHFVRIRRSTIVRIEGSRSCAPS